MRPLLAFIVASALLAIAGALGTLVNGEEDEAEVRVAAQLLADGRMEFALQQRQPGEDWGERVLPRARFFPANAAVDRWLASSPLTVEASDDGGSAEVRVAARRLADGRTEFALQQRQAGGDWGEHVLPRARFFPANPTVDRWLASSSLTIATALASTPTPTPEPSPVATPDPSPTPTSTPAPAPETSAATDRAALIALYNATGGSNWLTGTNWLTDEPLGEWHGVTTNEHGRVIDLYLGANHLAGTIPPELGDLTSLRSLGLDDNELTGHIPASIGRLANLVTLGLSRNELSGPIPAELGNLTRLHSLGLSDNKLSGQIPSELGNLAYLDRIFLSVNELSGQNPIRIGQSRESHLSAPG